MIEVVNFYHYGSTQKLNETFDHWIYIGRPSPKYGLDGSTLANPYKITPTKDRNFVIDKYKSWLWNNLTNEKVLRAMLQIRRHTRLVCWCSPKPCHGDVVAAAYNWLNSFAETEILMYQIHTGEYQTCLKDAEAFSYWAPYLSESAEHAQTHKQKTDDLLLTISEKISQQ